MPIDVFISYSSKNKSITDAMCHYLEEQRIRCWVAPRDILPGQEYAEAIALAMKEVKIFILVCSCNSLNSQWVRKETNLAVDEKKIILPFRIEDCSLEETPAMKFYLNDRHWIDAVPKPQEAFGKLATAVKVLLEPMNPSLPRLSEGKKPAATTASSHKQNTVEFSKNEADRLYSMGRFKQVTKFYQSRAEVGDVEAQRKLATMDLYLNGFRKNDEETLNLVRMAAQQGDVWAKRVLKRFGNGTLKERFLQFFENHSWLFHFILILLLVIIVWGVPVFLIASRFVARFFVDLP